MVIKSTLINDPDIADLIPQFLEELGKRTELIETAESESQWDSVYFFAHQIKGSGSSYGFPELTELAKTVTEHLVEIARSLAQNLFDAGKTPEDKTVEWTALLETPNKHRVIKYLCDNLEYRNYLDEMVIESTLPDELDALLQHMRDVLTEE